MLSRREDSFREDVDLVRCTSCGLVYLAGWADGFDERLYAYYDAGVGAARAERYDPLNTRQQEKLLRSWARRVRGRRLLDVGCGDGHLVDTAIHEGWDARGIDLADGAIQIAQSFGVPCERTDFFDPVLDRERYDVVVMSEFIEHVPDPQRFLARAAELLAPGGLLYATTPNFGSLTRRTVGARWALIHREHVAYFTQATLRSVAERAMPGYRVRVASKGLSPYAIARALRARSGPATDGSPQATEESSARAAQQRLRQVLASSALLERVKEGVNALAGLARLGDTLVLTVESRGA